MDAIAIAYKQSDVPVTDYEGDPPNYKLGLCNSGVINSCAIKKTLGRNK
jgi:hypothetical protein